MKLPSKFIATFIAVCLLSMAAFADEDSYDSNSESGPAWAYLAGVGLGVVIAVVVVLAQKKDHNDEQVDAATIQDSVYFPSSHLYNSDSLKSVQ